MSQGRRITLSASLLVALLCLMMLTASILAAAPVLPAPVNEQTDVRSDADLVVEDIRIDGLCADGCYAKELHIITVTFNNKCVRNGNCNHRYNKTQDQITPEFVYLEGDCSKHR